MKHLILLTGLALSACGSGAAEPWSRTPVKDLSPVQKVRFEEARLLAQTLGNALMHQLMSAHGGGSLADSISACREAAPRLAAEVSAKSGVKVGRTSHRLRNPGNRPPPWLADLGATEPQVYVGPNDEMGVALPIIAKEMCLACHGVKEGMDAGLVEKLGELYPEDRATGFAEGDLRGQFWVELPAPEE